jgi:hypothetical protein
MLGRDPIHQLLPRPAEPRRRKRTRSSAASAACHFRPVAGEIRSTSSALSACMSRSSCRHRVAPFIIPPSLVVEEDKDRSAPRQRAHPHVGDEDIGSGRQSPVPGQYLAGSTGIGKSWLACALGRKACRDNRSGQRVPKLFAELPLPSGDGRARILRSLIGVHSSFSTIGASSRSTPSV